MGGIHIGAPLSHVEPALPSGSMEGQMPSDGPRTEDEKSLLARIARADTRAFETLYQEYGRAVYSLALAMLRDPQTAQEVAQEVFLGIWRSASEFDSRRGSARTWILSLAHHKSVDAVRRQRLRVTWALDGTSTNDPDITAEAMRRVEGDQVRQALRVLSPEQREAIVLAYYGGYTQQEIAERLDIPLGTVKTRMRDGLLRLRSLLESRVRERDQ